MERDSKIFTEIKTQHCQDVRVFQVQLQIQCKLIKISESYFVDIDKLIHKVYEQARARIINVLLKVKSQLRR